MDDFERTPGGAILMDGNRLRDETVARIRKEIDAIGSPAVCLATVLVGGDKPSQIYVRMKHKKAGEAGMVSKGVELPEAVDPGRGRGGGRRIGRRPLGARHPRPAPAARPTSIPNRCSHCCRPRRTSTASPNARWVGSFVVCPATCRAPRSA